ncbi:hypothetical protein pEaSNUABM40_00253 [Erwinia phage pEa_SNUABM_40]|uniref:Uncharacterized protein n=1 Tax=Erwinia phage pEa_SNUABM_3 TaxID=2869552 RepID=A0AAE7XJM8_9CAUD|nr:hypothetical protein MPK68_gp250 [Erwinia phage pEa_SNUABM_3]QZE56447.1 hypothetical protein pEaSNUABM3_00250 [Erwinia phage pEa_SNUABM_3]QZE58469.1 hypothetical protein pEaSNUABM40_00253 [Erwinia phage pEa_SNUABM_40]UAW53030.1 hypothetical protein pEaSNUABM23_00248 [Erwinia phage pEa_SNUABM_23]UIW10925.1 hypothetical protein pEaSNUABM23_00248 [Erwinia phage pEa_SNUABM_31]
MSLISLKGVASTSAPTKAQKDAAVYMFGSKGHSIVAVLDKFSRAKELRTAHVDGMLKMMKEGEDDEIIKFTESAAGRKAIAAAKAFAVAKTLTASIKALKLIRVPVKWVAGHSDAAAARITETKEIRARKSAAGKAEKPIKLDNPGAPESTTVDNKVIDAKKGSATPATDDVSVIDRVVKNPSIKNTSIIIRRLFKGHETTSSLMFRKGVGTQSTLLGLGSHGNGHETGAGLLVAAFKATGIKPKWYLADAGDAAFDLGSAANVTKVFKWLSARKPGETFAATAKLPKSGKVPAGATRVVRDHIGKPEPVSKEKLASSTFDFVGVKSAAGGALKLQFKQPKNDNEWSLTIRRDKDSITSDHDGSSGYQTAESFLQRGITAIGGSVVAEHQQPGSAIFQFASEDQAKAYIAWLKKQKAQTINYKTEPKITVTKAASYTPSGKTDVSLVDEMAEVPARKIAAKPLQAREEYFNALRNILQNNLPKSEVSATSNGVVVAKGTKMYTIRLDDKSWTIQTGVTGKTKRIGATFDIVDLLGMIDKSILSPKA